MRHYARSLLCSGRQSLLRLGSFFVPSSNYFLISRHHANIRRWYYGVAPWVDVSEIPWRLTEALVAELSVCVALG